MTNKEHSNVSAVSKLSRGHGTLRVQEGTKQSTQSHKAALRTRSRLE